MADSAYPMRKVRRRLIERMRDKGLKIHIILALSHKKKPDRVQARRYCKKMCFLLYSKGSEPDPSINTSICSKLSLVTSLEYLTIKTVKRNAGNCGFVQNKIRFIRLILNLYQFAALLSIPIKLE